MTQAKLPPENPRRFTVFRNRARAAGEDDATFEHARVRQGLMLEDLKRYNVKAVLVDEYADVTAILEELVRRYRRRTVFVSASAADFTPWGEADVAAFMRTLGTALIGSGARVATGLGLGVGNALFTGAVEQVLRSRAGHIEDWIIVRPFPQAMPDAERRVLWEGYRQSIIGEAGISLFMFGNKDVGGKIVPAEGVRREFEIAREHGLVLLPIGATGSIARDLAAEALADADALLPGLDGAERAALARLAEPTDDLMTLVEPINQLVRTLKTGRR